MKRLFAVDAVDIHSKLAGLGFWLGSVLGWWCGGMKRLLDDDAGAVFPWPRLVCMLDVDSRGFMCVLRGAWNVGPTHGVVSCRVFTLELF